MMLLQHLFNMFQNAHMLGCASGDTNMWTAALGLDLHLRLRLILHVTGGFLKALLCRFQLRGT